MPATMPFPRRPVPPVARIRQKLNPEHIADVRAETRRRLMDAGLKEKVKPGSRIAITAGSRGMGGFVEILRGAIDAVREAGGEPFLLPSMGSHGGATPEGQVEILRRLGVTESSVDAPIRATMETRDLGAADNGARAHLDTIAAEEADGILILGRTKTHPESATGLASGLLKMVTIGLGNQIGAQEAHSHGLWESIRDVPKLTMARANILFGIAVVENAYRQPVVIEVVPATYEAFLDADERLLKTAQEHLVTIPFDRLDVLVVDKIGKDISGTGMDLNVIGTWRVKSAEEREPDYFRIAALSLTDGSLGNALGIGLADYTTERLKAAYDPDATYINLLTATEPDTMNTSEGGLPLALPSDREAIEVALYSALASDSPRLCRVASTAELDTLYVSEALLDEVTHNPNLTIEEPPAPLPFDAAGNLF